jgi:UDP-N-acetylglucosamine 2-epimerase (non-hydrolysing)
MRRILIVVGTRPNFIKITQFKNVAKAFKNVEIKIVHTGQHHDDKMANIFFQQFDLIPDFFLNISTTSPNTQMAEIMIGLEKIINQYNPTLLMVVGDVNSTFAAALTANKMGVQVAHIESGLRSLDRSMPEEFNRILTDEITDYFFVTEKSGVDNLKKEGKNIKNIFFVGNTMIDTIVAFQPQIEKSDVLNKLKVVAKKFGLMTMHRPSTVDTKEGLKKLLSIIDFITQNHQLVFSIHPRTKKKLSDFGMENDFIKNENLILTDSLDYFAFQKLISECKFIVTDSGGIQEESTFKQIPCITLRKNTERPSTVETGTNTLSSIDIESIKKHLEQIESGAYKKGGIPPLWDGQATQRILEILSK